MRKPSPTVPERSNVRMFYVDADLAPGEIQNITNALIAAIRPTHMVTRGGQQRIALPAANDNGKGAGQAELELDDAEIVEEREDDGAPAAPRGPRQRRIYKKPVPVEMDMKAGGVSFEDFAREKNPDSHFNRYLVAAAWLHDYAKLDTITVNHVYTCYKAASWTFDVADPGSVLREMKKEGLGTMNRGNFSIIHLGLSRVEKMKFSA